MDMIRVAVIGVIAGLLALGLKNAKGEFPTYINLAASVLELSSGLATDIGSLLAVPTGGASAASDDFLFCFESLALAWILVVDSQNGVEQCVGILFRAFLA